MRAAGSVLAVSTALLLGTLGYVFVACDDSSVPAALTLAGDDASADPDATPDFDGAAKGGLPQSEGGSPLQPIADDAGPLVIDKRCCNLTFRVDDPTNDESVAILRGDFAPLDDGGVPLTWSGDVDAGTGGWQAGACIPVNAYVRYGYFFGQDDSGAPDTRVNPDQPTVADGLGGSLNTFGPVANCSDADASTGMTR
jgi:hypothetical protein